MPTITLHSEQIEENNLLNAASPTSGSRCVCVSVTECVSLVERRRGVKADESIQQNLIYNASTDHVTTDKKSHLLANRDNSQPTRHGAESHPPRDVDKSSRPVPKPRTASTSDDLNQSVESDSAVRPRPRVRTASQESLDKNLDKPQHRPRTRASQNSLDKSLDHESRDKPVAGRRTRGSMDSMDERPTPAVRAGSMESLDSVGRPKPRAVKTAGSMESLDSIGRPKPRARASLDRSLDDSGAEMSTSQRPRAAPQVATKPARKPAAAASKDYRRAASSDETDV